MSSQIKNLPRRSRRGVELSSAGPPVARRYRAHELASISTTTATAAATAVAVGGGEGGVSELARPGSATGGGGAAERAEPPAEVEVNLEPLSLRV